MKGLKVDPGEFFYNIGRRIVWNFCFFILSCVSNLSLGKKKRTHEH